MQGDKIKVFEVNNTRPHVHAITQLKCKSYTDAAVLPKRMCDVSTTEISRWMTVSRNYVETVQFKVPRKVRQVERTLLERSPVVRASVERR